MRTASALVRAVLSRAPRPEGQARLRAAINRQRNWNNVAAFASLHLLAPAMHVALREAEMTCALPEDFAEFLAAVHEFNQERNRECMLEAARVALLLREAGIEPPVMLKGLAYLVTGVFADIGVRLMSDIDLLLRPDDAAEAMRVLTRSGMQCVTENDSTLDTSKHHHYPRLVRQGFPAALEVHRSLPEMFTQLHADDVLRAAMPAMVEGVPVRVPCPEHLVIHHIEHTQRRFGNRLRPPLRNVYDLALISERFGQQIDWALISWSFRKAGKERLLRAYLAFGSRFFQMQIPPPIRATIADRLGAWYAEALHVWGPWRYLDPLYLALCGSYCLRRASFLASSPVGRRRLVAGLFSRHAIGRIQSHL